jgi:hypothetical protein
MPSEVWISYKPKILLFFQKLKIMKSTANMREISVKNEADFSISRKCSVRNFLFFWYWNLNSGPTPWATPPALFCEGFFWERNLWTICLGWLWPAILLISASWVARIIGASHRLPARNFLIWKSVLRNYWV